MLATLETFGLIHQDSPRVGVYSRGPEDRDAWSYHLIDGVEKQVVLMGESIDLSAIYLDVEFAEPSELDTSPNEDV